MGKLDHPGYPLPDGELGDDELVCQLVYLPDRPEYWQALLAAVHYFSTWRAWERDDDKRGKDAASNWRDAFELTMECWRMTCLEQLQDDVRNIYLHLLNKKDCCDENVTYGDDTEYTTGIEPDEGDAPDYYGETAVTDWDDWKEHVCFNAHAWLDELINRTSDIESALTYGGMTIGLLAASLVAVSFFVVGGFVSMPLIYAAIAGLVSGIAATIFENAAEDLEDSRTLIVCALVNGESLLDAVESAVSGDAWTYFLKYVDYDSATAILYEGGDGETYLPADTRDDCTCPEGQIGEYRNDQDFSVEDEYPPWTDLVGFIWHAGGFVHVPFTSGYRQLYVTGAQLRSAAGLPAGDNIRIRRIGCQSWYTLGTDKLRIYVGHVGGNYVKDITLTATPTDYILNLDDEGQSLTTEPDDQIQVGGQFWGYDNFYLDDLWIEFDDLG